MSAEGANNAGAKAGSAIGGLFQSIGGAGEALRGTINQTLDSAGEGIAGRDASSTNPAASRANQSNASVIEQGKASLSEGLDRMQGNPQNPHTVAAENKTL